MSPLIDELIEAAARHAFWESVRRWAVVLALWLIALELLFR